MQDDAAHEFVGFPVAGPFEVAGVASIRERSGIDLHSHEAAVGSLGDYVDLGAAPVAEVMGSDVLVEPRGLAVYLVGDEPLEELTPGRSVGPATRGSSEQVRGEATVGEVNLRPASDLAGETARPRQQQDHMGHFRYSRYASVVLQPY